MDRLVAELAIAGAVQRSWFEAKPRQSEAIPPGTDPSTLAETDVWLAKEGKRGLIPAYQAMMEGTTDQGGKRTKRKDQILSRLSTLAQDLRKAHAAKADTAQD